MPEAKKIETCRLTRSELVPVFDLGSPCVSDFVRPGEEGVPSPLCMAVARDAPHLAQLTHSYPAEAMYKRYHYRSGTNEAMRRELWDVVEKSRRLRPVRDGETVLDIACNDGTLLEGWVHKEDADIYYLGIDPSDVAKEAMEQSPSMGFYNGFFGVGAYETVSSGPAAVITCIAMFYDLDDPVHFLCDVRKVIADDGLFVLQVAYTPLHVTAGAWDGICHEHLTAWDYNSLAGALRASGFAIVDAEITPSNGGSIRIYAVTAENYQAKCRSSSVEYMVGGERSAILRLFEAETRDFIPAYGWETVKTAWEGLARKAAGDAENLRRFLHVAKARGKSVVGLGASTKGNTILQFAGIGPDLLPCIADRQTQKHGLVTAGSNIPIISEEEMRKMRPDYLLALPWFFASGLAEREKDLLSSGTKMVVPLPYLTVL